MNYIQTIKILKVKIYFWYLYFYKNKLLGKWSSSTDIYDSWVKWT